MAVVLAMVLFAGGAGAQKVPDARERAARARVMRASMNQAVVMLRTNPRQAIDEMRRLLSEYPEQRRFIYEKLGYAYAYASMPDSAMAAYRACVSLDPITLSAARELAQLYITHGEQQKAERLFEEMLRRSKNRMQAYRAISQAQSGAGAHLAALETYRRARADAGEPGLFALEIGDLEKMAGNMEAALEEYIRYAGSSHPNINTAQDRLYEMLRHPKLDSHRVLARLEEQARSGNAARRQRMLTILAHIYYEAGMREKALEAALEADRLTAGNGRSLFALIQRLYNDYETDHGRGDGGLLDLCLRASDAYLTRYPRAAEAPGVYLIRASMLVEKSAARGGWRSPSGRTTAIDSAIAGLDQVITHYPGSRFAERAQLLKGDIYLFYRDAETALALYREGMQRAREYRLEFAERIARAYLALGRYDQGGAYCARLIASPDAHLSETGSYYAGLFLAFAGKHTAARDTLTAFAERSPGSAFTNDAIDLAWAIELGIRLDETMLDRYIDALRSEYAGDSSATLAALESFEELEPGTPLRPRALMRLGDLYRERGEFQKALRVFGLFLEQYPDHAFAPDVERRIGEVYEFGLADAPRALERYEHVLMAYPEYVFLDEVRREIVRLRNEKEEER